MAHIVHPKRRARFIFELEIPEDQRTDVELQFYLYHNFHQSAAVGPWVKRIHCDVGALVGVARPGGHQ